MRPTGKNLWVSAMFTQRKADIGGHEYCEYCSSCSGSPKNVYILYVRKSSAFGGLKIECQFEKYYKYCESSCLKSVNGPL